MHMCMHIHVYMHIMLMPILLEILLGGTKNRGGHIHLDTGPEKLSIVVFDAKCTCDSLF